MSAKWRWFLPVIVLTGACMGLSAIAAELESGVNPLPRAHAHNDYEHTRPLLDALDQGFCSIEADIYLVEGKLLVAHDRTEVSQDRTLERLYLDPLADRARRNSGRVYQGGPPVILLIDVKSEAAPTYIVLRGVLEKYTNILTRFSQGLTQTNAVTAIISGNRAQEIMAAELIRYAALDGRPEDLKSAAPRELIPLVSEDWKRLFKWRGIGPFADTEKQQLRDLVEQAHRQGRQLRFWGTPDRLEVWHELLRGGVDLLNADDLAGLSRFLNNPASSD